jgi:hypothetical protein
MAIVRMETHSANRDKIWLTALNFWRVAFTVFAQLVKKLVAFRETINFFIAAF